MAAFAALRDQIESHSARVSAKRRRTDALTALKFPVEDAFGRETRLEHHYLDWLFRHGRKKVCGVANSTLVQIRRYVHAEPRIHDLRDAPRRCAKRRGKLFEREIG